MTSSYNIIADANSGVIKVEGELTFATVNNVSIEAQQLLESAPTFTIDLTAVTRSDSAGLALLIDWMRMANTSNKHIVFHNIPAQMLAIANASGLDALLPID